MPLFAVYAIMSFFALSFFSLSLTAPLANNHIMAMAINSHSSAQEILINDNLLTTISNDLASRIALKLASDPTILGTARKLIKKTNMFLNGPLSVFISLTDSKELKVLFRTAQEVLKLLEKLIDGKKQ